ncbi:MAG: 2-keto-4-pentenoate hydratase [Dehalococcoidia bacterium]
MSAPNEIAETARELYQLYRQRNPFPPLPEPFASGTVEDAYPIQEEYLKLLIADQGEVVGYKLAYTTQTMQQIAGWDQPCAGALLSNTICPSPARLEGANYQRLGIECELAVQLGSDLPAEAAPYDREKVSQYVGAVMPAFEVIDIRVQEGLSGKERTLISVATNISNAGAVLGAAVTDWRQIDLPGLHCQLKINGEEAGEGYGSEVMGHPLEPLVWLANWRARQGLGLSQGSIVITGSIIAPRFLNPGDRAVLTMTGLGEVHLTVG